MTADEVDEPDGCSWRRAGDADGEADESGARRGAGEDSIAARSSEVQLCTGNAGQRMAEKSPDEREKCG